MMGVDDFGLSILASWLANKLEFRVRPPDRSAAQEHLDANQEFEDVVPKETGLAKFKTFDAWTDLSKFLAAVKEPIISVLIEDEPSTFYRLPAIVLESRLTGEWFVFSRGRMSFQGDGGGMRNSQAILDQVKRAGAAIGVWVLPQKLMSELDNGYETWGNIKPHAIPLLARVAQDYSWSEIEHNIAKQLRPEDA